MAIAEHGTGPSIVPARSAPGPPSLRADRRRGFTLLELLIALTIVAILAAIIIPTISGITHRQARQAVDQVEDLLLMYAYRDASGIQQVALWGSGPSEDRSGAVGGIMGLQILDVDPDYPNDPAVWVPDRFSTPLVLPPFLEIADVRVDGRRQYLEEFLITRQPSQPRPSIEVDLVGEGIATTLVLDPQALAPRRIDADGPAPIYRVPIDLDRGGRGRENW